MVQIYPQTLQLLLFKKIIKELKLQEYAELIERIHNLELEASQILERDRPAIIERIKKEIEFYRIPMAALVDKDQKYKNNKVTTKWCGRGRKPKWLKDNESASESQIAA